MTNFKPWGPEKPEPEVRTPIAGFLIIISVLCAGCAWAWWGWLLS